VELGVEGYVEPVKGWFDQSLPAHRDRVGPIALLRIDADWHASVSCCLENLFDQVVDGGLIVLDDYYTWSGCAVATHQFLGARGLGYPVEAPLGAGCGMPAVIRKGEQTWHELWRQISALDDTRRRKEELAAAIPAGHRVIVVGQDSLGDEMSLDWGVVPFLEKDGVYWGLPEDDATAIRELERLRTGGAGGSGGAAFIVFPSSEFWWFEHYVQFVHHLHTHARRVLINERLIAYDLRPADESRTP
jgi:hypothetical protein